VITETPSNHCFQLDQNFFGFKPEHRIDLHDNLFNLIWHGEGRWDWDTIYNMPVHIRRHWSKRVNDIIKTRIDATEAATKNKTKKPKA
jgi:hypothetical protein